MPAAGQVTLSCRAAGRSYGSTKTSHASAVCMQNGGAPHACVQSEKKLELSTTFPLVLLLKWTRNRLVKRLF